jgi:tetratricopeptide (TPR) repeat protein
MIPDSLINKIQDKVDQGDDALNDDEFRKAINLYREAVALLPRPKFRHAISLATYTALGEGYFFSGYYRKALVALKQALKAPGGVENPLLHLRMGQAYFELREFDAAADSLTRAYALDGRTVFEGEEDKYLLFLGTRIEL